MPAVWVWDLVVVVAECKNEGSVTCRPTTALNMEVQLQMQQNYFSPKIQGQACHNSRCPQQQQWLSEVMREDVADSEVVTEEEDRRGGFQPQSFGPPAQVFEMGTFMHATEGEMVCESVNAKIPYFNAPIYLENKTTIGKVDEILGPINQVYFTIKPQEGIQAASFKKGDKFYIGGDKLLPLEKFLPKPKPPPGAAKAEGEVHLVGEHPEAVALSVAVLEVLLEVVEEHPADGAFREGVGSAQEAVAGGEAQLDQRSFCPLFRIRIGVRMDTRG
ncbi:H/ACA ribonucleoprotein complex subunit 1 [Fonsecaea erecta]|uniref:H/ACA ribonucleoprotein complex subunit n=1 Tax=Fonsecaea erecta TaxID=1367422 RepID=A0A178ZHQ2_9EURO|nr:H/ACA ribonucleoprotein complex subunit 1 [Fonsecaea erecta]OAP58976.1 H/ACA ribonucleoprotein complex subunit 1 [Fonsecaea erecta]